MANKSPEGPVTQILYLEISPDHTLGDEKSDAGKKWASALDYLENNPGFRRASWGRRLEEPAKVQVHTGSIDYNGCNI
jgi:hypothetical protein